jgi:hypothetical protein
MGIHDLKALPVLARNESSNPIGLLSRDDIFQACSIGPARQAQRRCAPASGVHTSGDVSSSLARVGYVWRPTEESAGTAHSPTRCTTRFYR